MHASKRAWNTVVLLVWLQYLNTHVSNLRDMFWITGVGFSEGGSFQSAVGRQATVWGESPASRPHLEEETHENESMLAFLCRVKHWVNRSDANGIIVGPNKRLHGGTDLSSPCCIPRLIPIIHLIYISISQWLLSSNTPNPTAHTHTDTHTVQANSSIWIDYPHWW